MSTVLLVGGSPSPVSRSTALLERVGARLAAEGFVTSALPLRDLPPEALLRGDAEAPGVRESVAALAGAQGVVVATPVYKAAYAGLLKVWLDLLPQYALTGKTVLPLATGGSLAHVLAIDYALRPVLSSLAPRHVVGGCFVTEAAMPRSEDGAFTLDAEAQTRLDAAVDVFAIALRMDAARR